MTTTFKLACDRCGLSHREAAAFLNTRPDTVKSWSSGRNNAPESVIEELRALYEVIETAADSALAVIEEQEAERGSPPEVIELGLSSDDHEAQSLGFPCVGAHAASLGIVAATTEHPVKIVPRGTTLPTAKVADNHGQ